MFFSYREDRLTATLSCSNSLAMSPLRGPMCRFAKTSGCAPEVGSYVSIFVEQKALAPFLVLFFLKDKINCRPEEMLARLGISNSLVSYSGFLI